MTEEKNGIDYVRTRREAARILGCSVNTIKRIEKRGEIARTQISPRIIGYRQSAIDRYLAERTSEANHA
jgi:predicted DNA-binding transcriptional regulator AlpA